MIRPVTAAISALVATVVMVLPPPPAWATDAAGTEVDASTNTELLRGYIHEIRVAISRNWLLPDSEPGFRCVVEIEQAPGGELVTAGIAEPCDATEPVRQSLLAAIRRAEPLPYAGFEPVFRRMLRLTFQRDLDP